MSDRTLIADLLADPELCLDCIAHRAKLSLVEAEAAIDVMAATVNVHRTLGTCDGFGRTRSVASMS